MFRKMEMMTLTYLMDGHEIAPHWWSVRPISIAVRLLTDC